MKMPGDPFELPSDNKEKLQRAKRLEWITILFMLTIIAAISLTMGASQTMKAMWTEDVLSLIPPIAFLIGTRYMKKPPDEHFPYGYRRAVMIAFLAAAVALLGFGLYIFIDSVVKFIEAEHPTIQTVELFGQRVWLGWLMIAALLYSVIPPLILGHLKLPLARELHEKALMTDANINKGDWLSGLAGVLGILGIAYGLMLEAIDLTHRGAFVDIDTVEEDLTKWLCFYLEHDGDPQQLTVSSDASISSPRTLFQQMRACVLEHQIPLEQVLPLVTSNTARVLKLDDRGTLEAGKLADLLVLNRESLEIKDVICGGRRLMKNGRLTFNEKFLEESNRRIRLDGRKAKEFV